jgi:hypothetical protein
VSDGEADSLVQPPRGLIIAVDVDLRDAGPGLAQPAQRRQEDRATQTEAVEVGVDAERLDLRVRECRA